MKRPGRRTAGAAVVLALVVAGVVAGFVLLRGKSTEAVARDYLAATWEGDWRTECELATEEWRRYLFDGHPFASCADYATAADKADRDGGFEEFRDDTDVAITVEEFSNGDGRARVGYVIEFTYKGDDRAGFEELWQGGGTVDRGDVELVEVDGDWRIAGLAAG